MTVARAALITGGAAGIGAALARRLAADGAHVVIADIDDGRGSQLASQIDATFVHCDAGDIEDVRRAFAAATRELGNLDTVVLNAGVGGGPHIGANFDEAQYRRITRVNLDGVVFGAACAVAEMQPRGGDIVVTASLAGLTPMAFDPVYTATKHAVVGLVRSLAAAHAGDGIRINAVCPGFTDTEIIDPVREHLRDAGVPVLDTANVVDAFMAVLHAERTGECWFVQPGRPPEPYRFGGIPGARM